jgi:glycosyltransferase involved in cell wall biosynthesis
MPKRKADLKFVFWGRLTPLKNLLEAVDLISLLTDRHEDVSFVVIGPDAGCLSALESKIQLLGLKRQVELTGYRSQNEIAALAENASFFLQLSHQEGMAMSVVEAMQLGLVPVVTPVGEIANYCRHMENGIIHRDIPSTVAAIEAVVADPERYTAMSRAAIDTWRNAPLYADDFAAAAAELFAATEASARP